ncbi:MAG: hypothetical protein EP328_05095 [Gammaproteobacteria bacterium]|nr:MAG: hypothetical protein EP328_05095 [Gammaproteobacteria bacterium]
MGFSLIMRESEMHRFLVLPLFVMALFTQGCASYYSHSAMFPAENSRGEPRQVRLTWQTAEYPGWWVRSNQSTPIRLETQCSERVWRLRDASHEGAGNCGEGIAACGEPGKDLSFPKKVPATAHTRCLVVNPSEPAARIADIDGKLELAVSCMPKTVSVGQGDEKRNIDYLRASSVPYTVYVRKAPRGALRARVPEFDDGVCDAE